MVTKNLFKTKSFWTGIVGIITGVGVIIQGDSAAGIQIIVTGIATIVLRDAIVTK